MHRWFPDGRLRVRRWGSRARSEGAAADVSGPFAGRRRMTCLHRRLALRNGVASASGRARPPSGVVAKGTPARQERGAGARRRFLGLPIFGGLSRRSCAHCWLPERSPLVFLLGAAANCRHHVENFSRVEGVRQKIISSEIQHVRPKAFICQAIGHDQRRRMFHLLQFEKKVLPTVIIRHPTLADDHSHDGFTQNGLCLRKCACEPQVPIRAREYGGQRRPVFFSRKNRQDDLICDWLLRHLHSKPNIAHLPCWCARDQGWIYGPAHLEVFDDTKSSALSERYVRSKTTDAARTF